MRWRPAILSLATGAVLLSPATHEDALFTKCVNKATAYYRTIGQYPVLAIGVDADFVAREHCRRSPALFDGLGAARP